MNLCENFIKVAMSSQWNIVPGCNDLSKLKKSNAITRFNSSLPESMESLIRDFNLISNPSDDAWFLMSSDFLEESESAFKWDEFERQSMDAAIDENEEKAIRDFWNSHIPFFLSVKSGYSFFALQKLNDKFGAVVFGEEPEYERVEVFCDSFDDFLIRITNHLNGSFDKVMSRAI